MRALLDDLRYGVRVLVRTPRATSKSAAWLLAGLALGTALASWVDAPLAPLPGPASPSAGARVPVSRLLDRKAEARLHCLAGHPSCRPTPVPSPCSLPRADSLAS